ncbi:MAG: hypothetical protein WBD36_01880 [Bacteroidota bacterium]
MRVAAVITIACFFASSTGLAQFPKNYRMNAASTSGFPQTNAVNDILVRNDSLWFGTEKGLDLTSNNGISWIHYSNVSPFDDRGISAVASNDQVIWAATAYSVTQDDQSLPAGGGMYYSIDRGQTWHPVAQPVDTGVVNLINYGSNQIRSLAITTAVNNITYDLAVTSSAVWSANFAGMLRKSTNLGSSWSLVVLPPDGSPSRIKRTDTLNFDLAPTSGKAGLVGNLNHRVFSVFASNDSVLWVGTAGGINKSTDGGDSWQRFSHQDQAQGISGNFVVAINEQRWGTRTIVWAATINAESPDEKRGVSFTEDGGLTWKTTLLGEFAHNIAFRDSLVYIATDRGLYRSSDFGSSWIRNGSIVDTRTLQRFAAPEVYTVAAHGDTIWIGGPEGIAYTFDDASTPFGIQWNIFRTYEQVGSTGKTYSYPSPFSPDDEAVRIHYSNSGVASSSAVTIRIFDFAMQPVRTLIRNAPRSGATEFDEIWNGTNDHGGRVANGVYFYRVEVQGSDPAWGKIFVLQ